MKQKTILNRVLLRFAFILSTLWTTLGYSQENKSFAIVIPSWNNEEWITRNLDSVFSQSYQKYRVIYIDDASSDNTFALVRSYVEKNSLQGRVSLIQNPYPEGSLSSLYQAVQQCEPDEIIVPISGSDWFAHRLVLEQLNALYADPDVWLTHSNICSYPNYAISSHTPIAQWIIDDNAFRDYPLVLKGSKTFYADLLQRVQKDELLELEEFNSDVGDLSLSLPLFELAGNHCRFIPEVNLISNSDRWESDEIKYILYLYNVCKNEKHLPLTTKQQQQSLKKIYISRGWWAPLFAINNPVYNRDGSLEVTYRFREAARKEGFEVLEAENLDQLDDFEYLFVFDVFPYQQEALSRLPKEKLVLFLWEPPTTIPNNYILKYHRPFSKIYTWNDDLIDNEKYFKLHYPVLRPTIAETIPFDSKTLCSLIACNKQSSYVGELYTERSKVINFYEKHHFEDFILYGTNWPSTLGIYSGPVDTKVDTLKHFRFSYAYENVAGIPGYVTEKIFDCFHAGTVPIYWGASNIDDYIPKNCYIAREDFPDDDTLYHFLKDMSEEQHSQYLGNIHAFLKSEQAKPFTQDYFISQMLQLIKTPTTPNNEESL